MGNELKLLINYSIRLSLLVSILFFFMCRGSNSDHSTSPGNNNGKMKTLIVTRHAKSSWKDATLSDFERPLKKRGIRDAKTIGNIIATQKILPEMIISSPAQRALETSHILAKKLHYLKENIVYNKNIYEASTSELIHIIEGLNDSLESVLLIGHNPAFTNLVNYLSDTSISNLPTCGTVAIRFNGSWKDVHEHDGKIVFYEYPKKYKKDKKFK